jgi:hypothetical protein
MVRFLFFNKILIIFLEYLLANTYGNSAFEYMRKRIADAEDEHNARVASSATHICKFALLNFRLST